MALGHNLRAGLRLASLARVEAGDFRTGPNPLIILTSLWVAVACGCSWALTEPPRWFDVTAFESQAFGLVLLLGFGWITAWLAGRPEAALGIAVAYLATEPFTWLAYTGSHLGWDALGLGSAWLDWIIWTSIELWELAILYRAVRIMCGLTPLRSAPLAGAYAGFTIWLAFTLPGNAFFVTDTWSQDESAGEEPVVDVEGIFHAQHGLVQAGLANLRPGRPGVPDLYFVAFGADATQDVFRGEVEYARELFDERFDTAGRSLTLVNHDDTLQELPLASASNLEATLRGIGERMDRQEDVLFLYLTGHGSKEHDIAVQHPGLPLNQFGPDRLDAMLDASGIRWRVVVVSACYSGGFIEPLRDERTLVLTASAADRVSFGCGVESDFTYFGRALFAEQLTQHLSFTEAFEKARGSIEELELSEGREPSEPQMDAGELVLPKLAELEARLGAETPALAAAGL